MNDWGIYRGTGEPDDKAIQHLPAPPPWRKFDGAPTVSLSMDLPPSTRRRLGEKARAYQASDEEIELVNAALYLRRPLLVTGKPGTGKSTLAHSVARELVLGPVLSWPITSRSNRQEGLYSYDALARLQDASLAHQRGDAARLHPAGEVGRLQPGPEPTRFQLGGSTAGLQQSADAGLGIGRYIRLGPLGTALLPYERPRVVLIDELDKSDIDLPNDLLTLFEDGEYEIPELSRIARRHGQADVLTHDGTETVTIVKGKVTCRAFPLVIITSNGERDFPPPFLRRCLRLNMGKPDPERLANIVRSHLGDQALAEDGHDLIETFLNRQNDGDLATDQLLNAIYLSQNHAWPGDRDKLVSAIMKFLNPGGPE